MARTRPSCAAAFITHKAAVLCTSCAADGPECCTPKTCGDTDGNGGQAVCTDGKFLKKATVTKCTSCAKDGEECCRKDPTNLSGDEKAAEAKKLAQESKAKKEAAEAAKVAAEAEQKAASAKLEAAQKAAAAAEAAKKAASEASQKAAEEKAKNPMPLVILGAKLKGIP